MGFESHSETFYQSINYFQRSFYYDIALLKVPFVRFSTGIRPICLPRPWNGDVERFRDFAAKVSGFGKTSETGSPSNIMTTDDVQIFSYR